MTFPIVLLIAGGFLLAAGLFGRIVVKEDGMMNRTSATDFGYASAEPE